ncbi:hypothetical protein GRS48_14130 [Halorubrum sp. JWXQ-INN 858]|uniref:hypothetical protein n=1 Tax=Halorubrum sp. JWXQ-INN 858 TaxID=2690782 RepID=UPI0013598072|nr:hypothetical protein [Halorubrum sp. JWXQ-INN 858]MWV65946.1 hypothetical protein [Halorubrum sp. JWXQ-INN 858]
MPDQDPTSRWFTLRILGLRAKMQVKNVVRLAALGVLLLGAVNMLLPQMVGLGPFFDFYREFFTFAVQERGTAVINVGDAVLIAVGAVVAWKV